MNLRSNFELIRKKLSLVLWILSAGMLVAIAWHTVWQHLILKHRYPNDTFLYPSRASYTDFYDTVVSAGTANPYETGIYFPLSYLSLKPVSFLPMIGVNIVLFSSMVLAFLAMISLLTFALNASGWSLLKRVVYSTLAVLCCYPVLFCWNRGNIEYVLVLLVVGCIWLYSQRRFGLSMACLIPAICFKLYPAVLLALFFRKKLHRYIYLALFSVAVLTWISLISYEAPVSAQIGEWQAQANSCKDVYIIHNAGIGWSCTPWNTLRFFVDAFYSTPDKNRIWQMPFERIRELLPLYSYATAFLAILVASFALFVEREYYRKVLVLVLFMVMASPSGADYKLMHIGVALAAFCLMKGQRRNDLLIVFLLAFTLIPKREILLPYIGPTDSGYADVSIAILLNPICMMAALIFAVWDGFTEFSSAWTIARIKNTFQLQKMADLLFRFKNGLASVLVWVALLSLAALMVVIYKNQQNTVLREHIDVLKMADSNGVYTKTTPGIVTNLEFVADLTFANGANLHDLFQTADLDRGVRMEFASPRIFTLDSKDEPNVLGFSNAGNLEIFTSRLNLERAAEFPHAPVLMGFFGNASQNHFCSKLTSTILLNSPYQVSFTYDQEKNQLQFSSGNESKSIITAGRKPLLERVRIGNGYDGDRKFAGNLNVKKFLIKSVSYLSTDTSTQVILWTLFLIHILSAGYIILYYRPRELARPTLVGIINSSR